MQCVPGLVCAGESECAQENARAQCMQKYERRQQCAHSVCSHYTIPYTLPTVPYTLPARKCVPSVRS